MDLLERYLLAVGQHLSTRRDDTLAELRANLLAKIEGREEELGRPLTEAEVAKVLEEHGRPVLVAAQYMPRQYLIGPELFPVYWLTLKRSLPLLVLAYVLAQSAALIFHGTGVYDIWAAVADFPRVLFIFWAVMTLGYGIFEFAQGRYFAKIKISKNWNPFDLPPLAAQAKRPSWTSGLADLGVHILGIAWLLAVPYKPSLLLGPGLGILHVMPVGLTPGWHILYWQIVALLVLMLPLKAARLYLRPGRWRDGLQIAEQVLGIGILVVLVTARTYFVPVAGMTPHNLASLAGTNALLNLAFKILLVVRIVKVLWDIGKMITTSVIPRTATV
jgi:hypothetical protein